MALLPVYYTTTNLRKRKPKKTNTAEHTKWLESMGLTPKQIKAKKTKNTSWKSEYKDSLQVDRSTKHHEKSIQEVCNGGPDVTANRSVMANLHKESEETRKAILDKAKRIGPLWNKGGLMLITDDQDLTTLGRKV
jgi:hypothetical protein